MKMAATLFSLKISITVPPSADIIRPIFGFMVKLETALSLSPVFIMISSVDRETEGWIPGGVNSALIALVVLPEHTREGHSCHL